jgi:hypothetical protein
VLVSGKRLWASEWLPGAAAILADQQGSLGVDSHHLLRILWSNGQVEQKGVFEVMGQQQPVSVSSTSRHEADTGSESQ